MNDDTGRKAGTQTNDLKVSFPVEPALIRGPAKNRNILLAAIAPVEHFPEIEDAAAHYDVSLTSVRRAKELLLKVGLIELRRRVDGGEAVTAIHQEVFPTDADRASHKVHMKSKKAKAKAEIVTPEELVESLMAVVQNLKGAGYLSLRTRARVETLLEVIHTLLGDD